MSQYTSDDIYRQSVADKNGKAVMQLALQQANAHPDLTIPQAILSAYVVRYVHGIRSGVF